MVKKAFMKTVEIMLVIVITTIFLLVIIPNQPVSVREETGTYLIQLEQDEQFRNFLSSNNGCFNSTENNVNNFIGRYLPQEFDYTLCIGRKIQSVPNKNVYLDTLIYAGNYTDIDIKTIRLYYWSNQ